jgi:hypothetical protein
MYKITAYQKSEFEYYIPTWAITEDKSVLFLRSPESVSDNCHERSFELQEDRWFGVESGKIVRFRRTDEEKYRTQLFNNILKLASENIVDTKRSLSLVRNAASVVMIPLDELVSRINKSRTAGETLSDVVKRVGLENL